MDTEKYTGDRNLFAEERRRRILDMLSSDSRVLVSDLSERFGVSAATLRNDLRDLEGAGLLRRTHGGAVSIETKAVELSADIAQAENSNAKSAIGRAAAARIEEGDVIFCDSGSTTVEMVRALPALQDLTIITNDATIVFEAEQRLPSCRIIALGGIVRNGFHYTMGAVTVDQVSRLSATKAFVASSAFSFDRGFSTHTVDLSLFKRKLIERSHEAYVLMDASKFGTFATSTFAALDEVDALITDSGIDGKVRALIDESGTELVVA